MFTFPQGNFPSSSAYPAAEYKEGSIQTVGSSTLSGVDAGTQAIMNMLKHGCHLGGQWDFNLYCCLFNVYYGGYTDFQLWLNSFILYGR